MIDCTQFGAESNICYDCMSCWTSSCDILNLEVPSRCNQEFVEFATECNMVDKHLVQLCNDCINCIETTDSCSSISMDTPTYCLKHREETFDSDNYLSYIISSCDMYFVCIAFIMCFSVLSFYFACKEMNCKRRAIVSTQTENNEKCAEI